jgi:hypothetical protein
MAAAPPGGNHVAAAMDSLQQLAFGFESVTGDNRKALDEFAPPFPSPADAQGRTFAGRWPPGTTITCTIWEPPEGLFSVTFARHGSRIIAWIHPTGCLIGPVVELHAPPSESTFIGGLVEGFKLGYSKFGEIEFKDLKAEKWSFKFRPDDLQSVREWLGRFRIETMAARDDSLNAMLTETKAQGTGVAAPCHALEMEAPSGANSVLLAWAGRSLLVFRENKAPHPFFERQYAVFDTGRFSLHRGMGSAAGDLGLKLGGLGTLVGMRIDDASGKTFRIMGRKEVIEAIISEAEVRPAGNQGN